MRPNRLLRLFIVNWTAGVALGLVFAAALLLFDVAGIASLLRKSDMMLPGIALLFGGFAITCGGVVCASAVMFQAGREDTGPISGKGAPEPVRVSIRTTPARFHQARPD